MVKLLVLYGHPKDPAAFERHYAERHLPLAQQIPGLRRLETARVVARNGDQPDPYRVASLYFDSLDDLEAGMASDEGQASGADAASIATGGIDRLVFTLD
ncbi:MAG TPA: EthD family reductase [Baekduia sp.]|nr:EthD family reductase [Baekduia sp.]